MDCQRCLENKALYHVSSDFIDMMVCSSCAYVARQLGMPPRRLQEEHTGAENLLMPRSQGRHELGYRREKGSE